MKKRPCLLKPLADVVVSFAAPQLIVGLDFTKSLANRFIGLKIMVALSYRVFGAKECATKLEKLTGKRKYQN